MVTIYKDLIIKCEELSYHLTLYERRTPLRSEVVFNETQDLVGYSLV